MAQAKALLELWTDNAEEGIKEQLKQDKRQFSQEKGECMKKKFNLIMSLRNF